MGTILGVKSGMFARCEHMKRRTASQDADCSRSLPSWIRLTAWLLIALFTMAVIAGMSLYWARRLHSVARFIRPGLSRSQLSAASLIIGVLTFE